MVDPLIDLTLRLCDPSYFQPTSSQVRFLGVFQSKIVTRLENRCSENVMIVSLLTNFLDFTSIPTHYSSFSNLLCAVNLESTQTQKSVNKNSHTYLNNSAVEHCRIVLICVVIFPQHGLLQTVDDVSILYLNFEVNIRKHVILNFIVLSDGFHVHHLFLNVVRLK